MKTPFARVLALISFSALSMTGVEAFAHDTPHDDGAYGRFDGAWTIVGGVGVARRFGPGQSLGAVDVRARYLDTVGLAVAYEGGSTLAGDAQSASPRHAVLGSIELRPLFPARFLKLMESGHATRDLTLDSIALEVGALVSERARGSGLIVGLAVGLGIEVPLAAQSNGAWLRAGVSTRWSGESLRGEESGAGRSIVLTLGIAWHLVIESRSRLLE